MYITEKTRVETICSPMKGLEFSDYKYMIALQFVEIGLYLILTLVHNRKWERKSLQRKETPDEKKVKKTEGEGAPQGQKMYDNGHNLKRYELAVATSSRNYQTGRRLSPM